MAEVMESKEERNGDQFKKFMGKTQGMLKSRMMSFLGNSSDIITGISERLESALSVSESSSEYEDSEENLVRQVYGEDNQITPPSPPDPAFNRFKKLNALPNFGLSYEDRQALAKHKNKRNSIQKPHKKSGSQDSITAQSREYSNDSLRCEGSLDGNPDMSSAHVSLSQSAESNKEWHLVATGPDPYDKLKVKTELPSSGSASELDGYGPSTSLDSSNKDGKKYWARSDSEESVQSWASSLSLDSQSDEATVEFMRTFVSQLFKDSTSITLEQKAKFGELSQDETGRLWFSRFVNAQRGRSKCVSETTFFALIQYFAIVFFECGEADDFSPAKSLMNMCFTFYMEVEVPGCEPYQEYLYLFLKDQQIWHSLRFWNAAFFDALQCERLNKPVATREEIVSNNMEAFYDDKLYQENITFGQLGTFTYNMHAFGLSRDLCTEFLRKQCVIANLSKEQEKLLKDNVDKMYRETERWRN